MLIENAEFLRPSQKQLLQQGFGCMTFQDVTSREVSAQMLVAKSDNSMSTSEAQSVLDAIHVALSRKLLVPLQELLEADIACDSLRIATFSRELDALLGGGVSCGCLTEVCGPPGVGKTQLCMQLAVSVFLPKAFGGTGDNVSCIYIDTEGSFIGTRFREIAAAAVAQVIKIAHQPHWASSLTSSELDAMRLQAAMFTVEDILRGVKVARVCEFNEFLGLIRSLPSLVRNNPSIRAIIIDSVAFPFRTGRHSFDAATLSRMLFHVGQHLQRTAQEGSLAMVVTNQMTTRVHHDAGRSGTVHELVPALGDSWAHCVSTRMIMRAPPMPSVQMTEENGASQVRIMELVKSSSVERMGECTFVVCGAGIRNSS